LLRHGSAPSYRFTDTEPEIALPACFVAVPPWPSSKAGALAAIGDCQDRLLLIEVPLPRRIPPRHNPLSHGSFASADESVAVHSAAADLSLSSPQTKSGFADETKDFLLFRTTQQVRRILPRQPHDVTVPGSTTEILPLIPDNTAAAVTEIAAGQGQLKLV